MPIGAGAARVQAEVRFATKPALTRETIARALDAGVPAVWVANSHDQELRLEY